MDDGDAVDDLSDRVEIDRYGVEPLLSGALYAAGAVRGVNHPSCEYEPAMIRLAASP